MCLYFIVFDDGGGGDVDGASQVGTSLLGEQKATGMNETRNAQ